MANYEKNRKNSTKTRFSLGNLCFPLTSISVLMLEENDKLSLDDPEKPHLRIAIKGDPDPFNKYAGNYKLGSNTMRIIAEDDSLFMQLQVPGARKRNIQPETETKFFIGENAIYYSFSRRDDGNIEGFIIHWYRHEHEYKRTEQ